MTSSLAAENYSHEKIGFYFFQTLAALQFLHLNDFYYGDMKPANLLVFNDGRVKIGDLGISIKLDPNISETSKAYVLKGLTDAYTNSFYQEAMEKKL